MVAWTIKKRRDPHALDRLQRVQEAIYAQLQCLVPEWEVATGCHWVSNVRHGLPLHVEVLGNHPYTTFLRMTHHFAHYNDAAAQSAAVPPAGAGREMPGDGGREAAQTVENHWESEPEAHVRCYHDMHIAEVTAFDTVQGIRRVAHPSLPSRALLEMSWQRNRSLEKWLQYLLDQGHCRDTMQQSEALSGAQPPGQKKGLVTI